MLILGVKFASANATRYACKARLCHGTTPYSGHTFTLLSRVGPSPSCKWKAPAYLPNVKSGKKCTRDFSRSSEPTCPRYTKIKKKKKKRNWDGYTNIGDCINCCTVRTLRRQEVGKKRHKYTKKGRKMICNGRSQPAHFL